MRLSIAGPYMITHIRKSMKNQGLKIINSKMEQEIAS